MTSITFITINMVAHLTLNTVTIAVIFFSKNGLCISRLVLLHFVKSTLYLFNTWYVVCCRLVTQGGGDMAVPDPALPRRP